MNKEKLIEKMRQVSDAYVRDLIDEVPEAAHYLLMNDIAENMSISCAETALKELDNEWVRVEDGVPDDSMPVLCAHEYNGELFTGSITYFHYDDMWFREDGTECSKRNEKITHWKPLPSPPKDI